MRKLKFFVILYMIVMFFSGIIAHIINYREVYYGYPDPHFRISSALGWFIVFWIMLLISAAILALALFIIIIRKITQNMRKLKNFAILDGIVMTISWASIHILDYMGIYNKSLPTGLSLSIGWVFIFEITFLVSAVLLVLALTIIIMHKILRKVIQKIKKINNRA